MISRRHVFAFFLPRLAGGEPAKNSNRDFYQGSSTHTNVVLRGVLHPIELEFRYEKKPGKPGEKPLGAE